MTFEIEVSDCSDIPSATCGVALSNNRGQRVAFFHTLYHSGFWFGGTDKAWLTCTIPSLPLVPASYHVDLVMADDRGWIEKVDRADKIEVVFADVLGTGKIPSYHQGLVVLPCDWAVDGAPITERRHPQGSHRRHGPRRGDRRAEGRSRNSVTPAGNAAGLAGSTKSEARNPKHETRNKIRNGKEEIVETGVPRKLRGDAVSMISFFRHLFVICFGFRAS